MVMDVTTNLKTLLQVHLATDAAAVFHLPHVLSQLHPDCTHSNHLKKWTTRVTSLLHSKDQGVRWAGLCLAYKTTTMGKSILMDTASGWVPLAMSYLSGDGAATSKVAIRYIRHILAVSLDIQEFQRQLVIPLVPKFAAALTVFLGKDSDIGLKLLSLDTLIELIPIYPSLHRAQNSSLSTLCLRILDTSLVFGRSNDLIAHAARLLSVLHFTGGRVGAGSLWRKTLEDIIGFTWTAFVGLRTTFPGQNYPVSQGQDHDDPLASIPLYTNRLNNGVTALCHMLCTTALRPVQLPIGPIVKLAMSLLGCTADQKKEGHFDPITRDLEIAALPSVWTSGSRLTTALIRCTQTTITPHVTQLLGVLILHLERSSASGPRLPFIRTTKELLHACYPVLHARFPVTRLMKANLSLLTPLLLAQRDLRPEVGLEKQENKRSKKRRREYEGDEVFKRNRGTICATSDDEASLIEALDLLQVALRISCTVPSYHSLASRVLLSTAFALRTTSSSTLSHNARFHDVLYSKVCRLCIESARGSSNAMNKNLGLVLQGALNSCTRSNESPNDLYNDLELLMHPRLPPLVRPLPHVDELSLCRAEESNDERSARQAVGVYMVHDARSTSQTEMEHTNTLLHSSQQGDRNVLSRHSPVSMQPASTVVSVQSTSKASPTVIPQPPSQLSATPQFSQVVSSNASSVLPVPDASGHAPLSETSPFTNELGRSKSAAAFVGVKPTSMDVDDDEDDQELPAIDVESDSDIEG